MQCDAVWKNARVSLVLLLFARTFTRIWYFSSLFFVWKREGISSVPVGSGYAADADF